MTIAQPALLSAARDVHSQCGEDGIIEKALSILPARDKWCVEFGAWDGMFLCNSRNLIENKGYSAILIEGSTQRFENLRKNYAANANVITKNMFVGFRPGDSLDEILSATAIPVEFDFLSIDIDGNDYHVWKAFTKYRPKLVCIEFNQSIPTEVSFVQPADPNIAQGASLMALVELGREKGYELICVNECNAFFVDAKYFPLFDIADNNPLLLRTITSDVTYIFSGYDGTVFLAGARRLPWHNIPLHASRFQQLPRALRRFPGDYTKPQRYAFFAWKIWHSPRIMLERIRRRLSAPNAPHANSHP